jgi:peptide/nickel transport system permease protein
MGKYVVDSVGSSISAIMGFTLVVAGVCLVNLAVDVLYAFLDPQIRY